MCRLFAAELAQKNLDTKSFAAGQLLQDFSAACNSTEWNAPDGSKQEDGWGIYAEIPDYLGALSQLYHLVEDLKNGSSEVNFSFDSESSTWRFLYLSVNAIWDELDASAIAERLPQVSRVLVHARAALKGEAVGYNQPYNSESLQFAANTSFRVREKGTWKKIKKEFPNFKIFSGEIGTQRLFRLVQILTKNKTKKNFHLALTTLNQVISHYFEVTGMNIVTLSDEGIISLCGYHIQEDPQLAEYYTLYAGTTKVDGTDVKIVTSAPFSEMNLVPLQPGQVVTL